MLGRASEASGKTPGVAAVPQTVAAPEADEEGPASSPNTAPEAVTPAESPDAPRDEEPTGSKRTWQAPS